MNAYDFYSPGEKYAKRTSGHSEQVFGRVSLLRDVTGRNSRIRKSRRILSKSNKKWKVKLVY